MFAGIAGRYDIANRVLSLGIDRGWRRRLIQKVSDLNPRNVATWQPVVVTWLWK